MSVAVAQTYSGLRGLFLRVGHWWLGMHMPALETQTVAFQSCSSSQLSSSSSSSRRRRKCGRLKPLLCLVAFCWAVLAVVWWDSTWTWVGPCAFMIALNLLPGRWDFRCVLSVPYWGLFCVCENRSYVCVFLLSQVWGSSGRLLAWHVCISGFKSGRNLTLPHYDYSLFA